MKINYLIIIFSLIFFVGCNNKAVQIPYEKESKEICNDDKISMYRSLNKILLKDNNLKNLIIDLGTLHFKISNQLKTSEEIELFTFNDLYTTKESACNSSDIRMENFNKVNKIFIDTTGESFNKWAKTYLNYLNEINLDYRNQLEYQLEYMDNMMNDNIKNKKVMSIIVNNNTGRNLSFKISDLKIKWKNIENEGNLKEDFNNNLKLIGIEQLYSTE
jgi:hypothetical protein